MIIYNWNFETVDLAPYLKEGKTYWRPARTGIEGGAKGSRDFPGRLLVPCPIPPMDLQPERFEAVRLANFIQPAFIFQQGYCKIQFL